MSMGGRKGQPLVSSRYAAMYLPNTEWVFMDAISKSDQTKAAFAQGEISTKGKNISKYLELTVAERLRLYRESQRSTTPQPPTHILELLKLQSERGKFECLADVMKCLFMPLGVKFRYDHMFTEWEKATAYAIAAIRQQNEHFDYLCPAHDKAFACMDSNEIIFEARELLNAHQFTSAEEPDSTSSHPSEQQQQPQQQEQELTAVFEEEYPSEHTSLSSHFLLKKQSLPLAGGSMGQYNAEGPGYSGGLTTAQLAQAFQGLHTIEELNDDMSAATAEHSDIMSDIDANEEQQRLQQLQQHHQELQEGLTLRPVSPSSFNALQDKLVQLSANRDEVKIAEQQAIVNRLQLEVISLCIEIEKLVLEVHLVAQRCIRHYNECETRNQRFRQFDELTCMLGDGRPPTVGFSDWRERGVVGVRPTMIRFFHTVQRMAEERLTLQELEQPGARALDAKISVEANLSRWKLLWNGHDVVHRVLHSLDFLRKCRELSEWYGPSFYFVANPLMLPFSLHTACCAEEGAPIDMKTKVEDQQRSVPHLRLGNANTARKAEWEHQQYLEKWRRQFQEAAQCWSFNWPLVPDIREDPAHEQLFDALLVPCITCQATLRKSYLWEKKFISQIHSVRGQDRLLIGNNTSKVDKKLEIPPAIARKPRPVDILKVQEPRASDLDHSGRRRSSAFLHNRRSSDASSFAPYGYSLMESTHSQSQSEGLLDLSQEDGGEKGSPGGSPALRPNLMKAMQFTKLVKTAEEKAALRAQQQLAQSRKASVLNRNTLLPGAKRGTHLLNRARSPSTALPGSSSSDRRTSSRPSVSAGAGDSADAMGGSPGGGGGSPGKLSLLRKSSSASAAGMARQDSQRKHSAALGVTAGDGTDSSANNNHSNNTNNRSSMLMHSPLRKSSSVSGAQLQKSSSASAMNSNSMTPGVTGKFNGSSQPQSSLPRGSTLTRLSSAAIIHEEGSFDSEGFEGEETTAPAAAGGSNAINRKGTGSPSKGKKGSLLEPVSAPAAIPDKKGSVLRKSSTAPQLSKIVETGGTSAGAGGRASSAAGAAAAGKTPALAAVTEEARATPSLRVKMPSAANLTSGTSGKSTRLSLLPPSELAGGSVSSGDSRGPGKKGRGGAKEKKHRKKSTTSGVAAEDSMDNTTVSLALASPPQNAEKRKQSRQPSATAKKQQQQQRQQSATDSEPDSPEARAGGTPKSATRKKRGSSLVSEKAQHTTTSNIVTRLPPVQGNVRLTRRKED